MSVTVHFKLHENGLIVPDCGSLLCSLCIYNLARKLNPLWGSFAIIAQYMAHTVNASWKEHIEPFVAQFTDMHAIYPFCPIGKVCYHVPLFENT